MQLSGFGPAAKLQAYGIPVLGNLPGVGNNLQDHCLVNVDYECTCNGQSNEAGPNVS